MKKLILFSALALISMAGCQRPNHILSSVNECYVDAYGQTICNGVGANGNPGSWGYGNGYPVTAGYPVQEPRRWGWDWEHNRPFEGGHRPGEPIRPVGGRPGPVRPEPRR